MKQRLMLSLSAFVASGAFAMLPNPPINSTTLQPINAAPPALNMIPAQTQGSAVSQASVLTDSQHQVAQAIYAYLVRTDANGQEQLVPINTSTPISRGDVVEYHGYFTNKTSDRIRSMSAMMTIPQGAELISMTPTDASASLDGVKFSRAPLRTLVNGQPQNVPLSRYKAIRWNIDDVGLNGTAVTKIRAKIK